MLLDLKSKNTSWKQISIMMEGKPQWELRNRFKELSAPKGEEKKEEAKGDEKKEETKGEEKKKKEEEGRAKAAEKKKEKEKEKDDGKKEGGDGEGRGAETEEAKIIFVDDGKFTLDEVILHPMSSVVVSSGKSSDRVIRWCSFTGSRSDTTTGSGWKSLPSSSIPRAGGSIRMICALRFMVAVANECHGRRAWGGGDFYAEFHPSNYEDRELGKIPRWR